MTEHLSDPPARLIRLGTEQSSSYELSAELCMIGRSPLCQMVIVHEIISRLHARIERNGSAYFLSDAGSANGTFVNGRPLRTPHLLVDGDTIGLGSAAPILRFDAGKSDKTIVVTQPVTHIETPSFVVARTKLRPPRLRSEIVARPRLVDTIRRAVANVRLALVSAPAGYGKTTLVAHAISALSEAKVTWLTLDSDDNVLPRFLHAFASALQPILPTFSANAMMILASCKGEQRKLPMLGQAVMIALINELFEVEAPVCMVLDDLHYVTDEAIHTTLNFLIERLPPHATMVIATRHDPMLALSQLRARREMVELRLEELRFTPDESSLFWNQQLKTNLNNNELASLTKHTEGWPAGMMLLSASLDELETQAARDFFLDQLTHGNRYIFDYLAEAVFSRETAATKEFLVAISILDELSPALCQAVSGRADAGQILDDLHHRNLFLIGLESDDQSTYRFHDLFRTFLQEQLYRRPPEEVRQWHRRAAQASPQLARKINHLLLAEAFDEAASEIEAIAAQMIEEGWGVQLPEWIARLPSQSVTEHPRLALLMGMSRLAEMQNNEAKRWLTQARRGLAAAGDEAGEADALASLSQCLAVLNENEAAAQVIAETLTRPLTIPQRILVLAAQAYVDIDHANVANALGNYAEAIRLAELQPTPAAVNTLALNLHSGVMNEPLSTPLAERLARLFTNYAFNNRMVEGMAHVWQAWAYLGRGQPTQAIEQMQQALEISRQLGGSFNIACESFGLPVWLAFLGNASQSEEALTRFHEELDRSSLTGFRQTVGDGYAYEIGRAKWNLRRDDELRTLYEQLPRNQSTNGRTRTPILHDLIQGMLLLSDQQYQEAAICFERASTHGAVTLYFAKHAEALLAHTYYLQGAQDRALERFVPILDFFAAEGTLGHIWNMGPRVVKPLLALALERNVQTVVARTILAWMPDALGNSGNISATPTGSIANVPSTGMRIPDTGETLSEREIEVIQLIARGDDNPTIAETLMVSVHTVKSHVAHILAKLGVSSRTAAAVRAKELGLVK